MPADQPLQRCHVGFVEILVDHLADRLDHLDPLEGTRDRDLFSLVPNRWRAVDALRQVDHERLGQLHHALDIRVGLVELQHRVLGAVPLVHALVAENAPDLKDAVEAADDEALQIELEGDSEVELHVKRVMVSPKGTRRGTAGHGLQHRRFDLDEAPAAQEGPRFIDHAASGQKDLHHLGIGDQIEIALPIAQLDVAQTVVLLGQRS